MSGSAPLEGVVVVDESSGPVAGLATMVMSDFGARVIKVEPAAGDPYREQPSAPLWLRGKQSVVLDTRAAADRAHLAALAARADVWVRGPDLDTTGLQDDALLAINPRLILAWVSAFGRSGPYAAYPAHEAIVAARVGRMLQFRGLPSRPGPVYAALQVATHAASQSLLSGILAALHARARDGTGQVIETSLLRGLLPYDMQGVLTPQVERWLQARGEPPLPPVPDPATAMPTLNYHPLRTRDGRWLQMGNLLPHLFLNFVRAAGLEAEFAALGETGPTSLWPEDKREHFRELMLARMQDKTLDEWQRLFVADGGIASHPYQSTQEALDDPDVVANGHSVPLGEDGRQLGLLREPDRHAGPGRRLGAGDRPAHERAPRRAGRGRGAGRAARGPGRAIAGRACAPGGAARRRHDRRGRDDHRRPFRRGTAGRHGRAGHQVRTAGGRPVPHDGTRPGRRSRQHGQGEHRPRPEEARGAADRAAAAREGRRVHPQLPARRAGTAGPGLRRSGGAESAAGLRVGQRLRPCRPRRAAPLDASDPRRRPRRGAAPDRRGPRHRPDRCGAIARDGAPADARQRRQSGPQHLAGDLFRGAARALAAQRRSGVGQQVFVDMFGSNAYANFDDCLRYPGKAPRLSPDRDRLRSRSAVAAVPVRPRLGVPGIPTPRSGVQARARSATWPPADCRRTPTLPGRGGAQVAYSAAVDVRRADAAAEWEARLAPQRRGLRAGRRRAAGAVLRRRSARARRRAGHCRRRHPSLGRLPAPRRTDRFHGTPCELRGATLRGDCTDALLAELGIDDDERRRLREMRVVA